MTDKRDRHRDILIPHKNENHLARLDLKKWEYRPGSMARFVYWGTGITFLIAMLWLVLPLFLDVGENHLRIYYSLMMLFGSFLWITLIVFFVVNKRYNKGFYESVFEEHLDTVFRSVAEMNVGYKRRWNFIPRNIRSLMFILLFILILAVSIFILVKFRSILPHANLTVIVAGLLLGPVWWSLRTANRVNRESANGILSKNPSLSPILFLRSFTDDDLKLKNISNVRTITHPKARFEERVCNEFSRLGPVIAIGKPKEKLPLLGAYRSYFKDEDWQEGVSGWMHSAKFILLIAGNTSGLKWEITTILEFNYCDKLIVLLPPSTAEDCRRRLTIIRECMTGSLWDDALTSNDLERSLALVFLAGGNLVTIFNSGIISNNGESPINTNLQKFIGVASVACTIFPKSSEKISKDFRDKLIDS